MIDPLTERETAVLHLMADGLTNADIAKQLVLTVGTVRWYTKQIYSKLGVHGRSQAILRAQESGLVGNKQPSRESTAIVHKIPHYPTQFWGRTAEQAEIFKLVQDPAVRLVTIAGAGGMGKTRLAVEVAHQLAQNNDTSVFFVPLAPVHTVDGIPAVIATVLDLSLNAANDPHEQLFHHLKTKPCLLVLDNLEHIPDIETWVSKLLKATQTLTCLVTSQRSLNISAEWVRVLQGMEDGGEDTAVALLHDRIGRVKAGFSRQAHEKTLLAICQQVQGLPLALEMIAPWFKSLSGDEILTMLQQETTLLTTRSRDVEARHASLEALFEYSWQLLTTEEQDVLMRLSAFRGGFGLTVGQEVAGATLPLLTDLVDKSFLAPTDNGGYQFQELVRQFIEAKLTRKPTAQLSTRSGKMLSLVLLLNGDFEKADEVAQDILERKVDDGMEQAFAYALIGILAGMDEAYERCHQLCMAAYALHQKYSELTDPVATLFIRFGLAVGYCGADDYASAKQWITAAFEQATQLKSPAFSVLCLPIRAIILAHEAESETAVKYLALASKQQVNLPTWLKKWPLLVELQQDLKAELGEALFEEAWGAGLAMRLETAVL